MKRKRFTPTVLVVSLPTLLGHVFSDDESMGMHGTKHDGAMMHSGDESE